MPSRTALLALLLLAGTIWIGERTYRLWKDWPWEVDKPQLALTPARSDTTGRPQEQFARVDVIIAKNLFDPDRGAATDKDKERESQALAQAMQRMQGMVLVGTVVLGDSRYAIVEDPGDARPAGPRPTGAQKAQTRRLKLGDTVEGFQLSAIDDRKIVFSKGESRVDVAIDYFRKVEAGRQVGSAPAPSPARPSMQGTQPSPLPVAPRVPRREMANQR